MMKKAAAITCVFLNIGDVLITNGWDLHARKQGAIPRWVFELPPWHWTNLEWLRGLQTPCKQLAFSVGKRGIAGALLTGEPP